MRLVASLVLLFCVTAHGKFVPVDRPYDAKHYKIFWEVDPSTDPTAFDAVAEIELVATKSLRRIDFDTKDLTIKKVELLNPQIQRLRYTLGKDGTLRIPMPSRMKKGQNIRMAITYSAKIFENSHEGIFKVSDPDNPARGRLIFSQFEALHARAFFPCNDQPFDKATTEVITLTPATNTVISNGRVTRNRVVARKDKKWREVHWKMTKPHSTYLVSVAVGPFQALSTRYRGKRIRVYVGENQKKEAKYLFEATPKLMKFFDSYLGVRYPWRKYDTIAVPTFLWGGMENTSATTINADAALLHDPRSASGKRRIVSLQAHELAHQWFGDYVTMKWWDDLWLNESFASHLATVATSDFMKTVEPELRLVLWTWDGYFRQEDGPRSHPIVMNELKDPGDAFDSISYTKGENVLRMLSAHIGEKKFRAGLKNYLKKYAYSNATYKDFFAQMSRASKMNLDKFRDSWLLQRGYPVVSYGGEFKDGQYTFKLSQASNHPNDKSIFVFKMPVILHRNSTPKYTKRVLLDVTKASHQLKIKVPAEPEWITVNPRSVVLAKLKPSLSQENLVAQALNDPDEISRVWAIYHLTEPYRSGKDDLPDNLAATVLKVLKQDKSPYVRVAVLEAFQKMKRRWLTDELGEAIFKMAQAVSTDKFFSFPLYKTDPQGWSQYRSNLFGTLGKIEEDEVDALIAELLLNKALPLDDLQETAMAAAKRGNDKGLESLQKASVVHGGRGYRYQYLIEFAYGSFENPKAANAIFQLTKTAKPDLIGRIGWAVSRNETLKNSSEWSSFLETFVLTSERFSDNVKIRLLNSVEDVKEGHVKSMMETIAKKTKSERIKDVVKQILKKNFNVTLGASNPRATLTRFV